MQEGIEKIEWKDIPEYEGVYQASKCGQIRRLAQPDSNIPRLRKEKILFAECGYYDNYCFVGLRKNGKIKTAPVHRLVAKTFLDNPEGKPCVNHKDRTRSNNHVDNLEWCTHKENSQHAAMMDKKHLESLQIGCKVILDRDKTKAVSVITELDGNYIYIDPSPEPHPNNFWHYKNLKLINNQCARQS